MGSYVNPSATKARLLQAAETLFIEHGYEAMSLRQITTQAGANLASVNYHFGSKEALIQELLSRRLDRLNQERAELLAACEQRYGGRAMEVSVVLSVMFVPALRLARDCAGGPAFMRLLGRVYIDPSPFIRSYLHDHYQTFFERFFAAFARALPNLSRNELGVRLQFSLKAVSGVLAGENLDALIAAMCVGGAVSDSLLLSRLVAFISPMLTTPFGQPEHTDAIERVMTLADAAAHAADQHPNREPVVVSNAVDSQALWLASVARL
jgi:AcrR family transcriptional regulator